MEDARRRASPRVLLTRLLRSRSAAQRSDRRSMVSNHVWCRVPLVSGSLHHWSRNQGYPAPLVSGRYTDRTDRHRSPQRPGPRQTDGPADPAPGHRELRASRERRDQPAGGVSEFKGRASLRP